MAGGARSWLGRASDASRVVAAYRDAYPDARPSDVYILICTDHPRGMYARELARRKTAQGGPLPGSTGSTGTWAAS